MPLWTLLLALTAWVAAPQAAAPRTIFDLVKSGTPEQVRAMVAKDAALVNTKDAAGNTPLHHAAINGSVPMAETLLSHGAPIDAVSSQASADILYSKFEHGRYSTPVNLGPAINTREVEVCPFIAPDESYLIFSRASGPEPGYFIAYRLKDGAWSQPIGLKHLRGGPTSFVSPDGKYVFFGYQNGFWAPATVIEELRPKEGR